MMQAVATRLLLHTDPVRVCLGESSAMDAGGTVDAASDLKTAQKRAAAIAAVRAEVRSGMRLGLGTGTTAYFVLEELGQRIHDEGLAIQGVATSVETERLARERGISMIDLPESLDLAIDGADEVDARRTLTKGGSGAMTREKCVAQAARRLVIVVDEAKLVPRLVWPVPVEVLPFAAPLVSRLIQDRFPTCTPVLRRSGDTPFVTDNGNYILDVGFHGLRPPASRLAAGLKMTTGVVEHGLFVQLHPAVYVAGTAGVRVLQ